MNRGNRRQDIFETEQDQHFLWIPVERIIAEVARAANVKTGDLRDRRTKFKDLRRIAMELSCRYRNHKQKEIGVIFGVDCSIVSQNRLRLKRKLKSNRKWKK
jgi:chromosomal replication initiation ATPase DnaA